MLWKTGCVKIYLILVNIAGEGRTAIRFSCGDSLPCDSVFIIPSQPLKSF